MMCKKYHKRIDHNHESSVVWFKGNIKENLQEKIVLVLWYNATVN